MPLKDKEARKQYQKTGNAKWQRYYRAKTLYGMSKEEYDAFVSPAQCQICGTTEHGNRYFNIDHCHKTGKVRGLLCNNCNRALGYFKDNIEVLKNAIKYLTEKG